MKILFIDSYTCAYNTKTYLEKPLGGTQSAVSCLSKALAARGHRVSVINGVETPVETDGVQFMSLPCPTPVLNEFDVIIGASAVVAKPLREIGCTRPVVLWSHHAADQPSVQGLKDVSEHSAFAGIALISEWHVQNYATAFNMTPDNIKVMKNGVHPVFFNRRPASRWLKTGTAPVLGYTSTPYRGLDILLLSFSMIRKHLDGATLRIFSGMKIYGDHGKEDDHDSLYDLANNMPGVTYVGPLPQARLAEELSNVDIWSYPCTFSETSCMSAMEAMAAGTSLISTTLGALPETTSGYGHLIDLNIPGARTPAKMATRFARHVLATTEELLKAPETAEEALNKQIAFTQETYNWETRADEWIEWLKKII